MERKKLIFSILKEIEKGNRPSHEDYGLSLEEFGGLIEIIIDDKLIKNGSVIRAGIGNKVKGYLLNHAQITLKGEEFLKENSIWSKTYNTAKELRDWMKL